MSVGTARSWARQELLWRLLLVFSAATTVAAVAFGTFFLLVGGSALGWVINGLALPLLVPWALRRRLSSPRVAANVYLAAGTVMVLWITWVSGAARSTAYAAVLLLPIVAVLLVPLRDARRWLFTVIVGVVGVFAGDSLGLAPPSLVPATYMAETRLLTLLTGAGVAYLFSLIFRASYHRAQDELETSRRAMDDLLLGLGAASADLRRAAAALNGGAVEAAGGGERRGTSADAQETQRGLIAALREEVDRAQELADRAGRTVEGFGRTYESIGGEILALSSRLAEVGKLAESVQALGARLDILALHVGVQASLVGDAARPFQRLSDTARALAKRVEADAERIAATMERIHGAGGRAATLAWEGTGLRREAAPRLEAMRRSFARVADLAQRASDVGEGVVAAALQHLSAIEAGFRDVGGPRSTGEPQRRGPTPAAPAAAVNDQWARLPSLFVGVGVAALGTAALFGGVNDPVSAALFGALGILALAAAFVPAPVAAQPWLAFLFLVETGTLVAGGAWLSGGLASPAFPGLVLFPVLGVFLFGPAAGSVGAGLALGVGGLFWAADVAGVLPAVPFAPGTWAALDAIIAVLFLTRLYQYSSWSRDQITSRIAHLEADDRRVQAVARELRAAGAALDLSTEELRGGSLVEIMRQESAAGDEHTRETVAAFTEFMGRYEAIAEAIDQAYAEAVGLDEALHRVDEMAHDVDLLALQIALEAVRVGEQGAAFRLLADEMTRLSAAARADANEMSARLSGARDAVLRTRGLTNEGRDEAHMAGEAVRALATSFQDACALMERGADASQRLAALADGQLQQLRDGLGSRV